jgi:hypothetical protein
MLNPYQIMYDWKQAREEVTSGFLGKNSGTECVSDLPDTIGGERGGCPGRWDNPT